MENTLPIDKLSTINDLLKDLPVSPVVAVDLPSKNKFYTLKDPTQPITLRAMDWTDEQALLGAKKRDSHLNILLGRTLTNVDVAQILPIDKLALLIKLREISIAKTYEAPITCPACDSQNQVEVDLSEFKVNYVPDAITDPITFKLPKLNKNITVRIQRLRDEEFFSVPSLIHNNLWRFVESIETVTDKVVIAEVIKKLPLQDLSVILRFISLDDYGLDRHFNYVCPQCNTTSIMEMPIGTDFFTMR